MAVAARCTFSTSRALHGIFVAPYTPRSPIALNLARPLPTTRLPNSTSNSTHITVQGNRNYASRAPSAKRDLPKNEMIKAKYKYIHLSNGRGEVSELRTPYSVLASMDRDKESLIAISIPVENQAPDAPRWPVCKIVDKLALYKSQRAAKKSAQTKPSAVVKTIELNWAIDEHDFGHRCRRIEDFLSSGNRVDVMFAGKRKGRKATPEEAQVMLDKVKDVVEGEAGKAKGWKIWKNTEGVLCGPMTIYLQGKAVTIDEKAGAAPEDKADSPPVPATE